MQSTTLLRAIRILSVDVANASGQIAVYRAQTEELQEAVQAVDVRSWERRVLDDGNPLSSYEVVLPADQEDALNTLLNLLANLG